jgi:putative peptidoglycan lipid II flippase
MVSGHGKVVLKGAAIISAFVLVGKVMGFFQKQVVAHYFGTGMQADAFTLAFSSIVFAIGLFPQQLLSPFLPIFAEKREKEGEAAAWRLAGSVGSLVLLALVATVIAGMIFAPQLVKVASSFKSADTTLLAVKLVRTMMPAVFFMGLFALLALLLNAQKRFARPAMGDTANKLALILCLILLYQVFGIYGLAIGVVVGAAVGFVIAATGLKDKIRDLSFGIDWKDPALKQLGVLMLPILLSVVIAQIRTIIDYKFASGMAEGSAASINYSRSLVDTLVMLIPSAIGVAIYPVFSDLTAMKDRAALSDLLMRSLRMMVFIFIPVSVALVLLGTPIVQIAFQRGQFTQDSVALTVAPLTYYSLGLTAFALEIILMRFYFSMKNTLTPTIVGGLCVLVHLGVILLVKDHLQNASMALAATISKGAKVAILFVLMGSFLPTLHWKKNGLFVLKALIAAACMGVALSLTFKGVTAILPHPESIGKFARLLVLATETGVAAGAGMAVFAGMALALRMEESSFILAWVKKRVGTRVSRVG